MTVILRWAGPSDAGQASLYRVERCLDGATWEELTVGQVATAPYVSPVSALGSDVSYGDTTMTLEDASAFPVSGCGVLDEAEFGWAGKNGDLLTGVTWRTGCGTYAAGSVVYQAHEEYVDLDPAITLGAALYRITHIASYGSSAPTPIWYFAPSVPVDSHHCVVVVFVGTDVGGALREGVTVRCWLERDDEFNALTGEHLDSDEDGANTQVTNAFGLAFFDCVHTTRRVTAAGEAGGRYLFELGSAGDRPARVAVDVIPARDWVLLSEVVSGTVETT